LGLIEPSALRSAICSVSIFEGRFIEGTPGSWGDSRSRQFESLLTREERRSGWRNRNSYQSGGSYRQTFAHSAISALYVRSRLFFEGQGLIPGEYKFGGWGTTAASSEYRRHRSRAAATLDLWNNNGKPGLCNRADAGSERGRLNDWLDYRPGRLLSPRKERKNLQIHGAGSRIKCSLCALFVSAGPAHRNGFRLYSRSAILSREFRKRLLGGGATTWF